VSDDSAETQRNERSGMIEVVSPDEIPAFANEGEAHAFRSTHGIGKAYVDRVGGWTPEADLANRLPPKRKRTAAASFLPSPRGRGPG